MKTLRKELGTESIVEIYHKILETVSSDNTDDVNEFRSRFENNFLPFCQKHVSQTKYQDQDTGRPDAKQILNAYIKHEKNLKTLFTLKWASGILAIICALIAALPAFIQGDSGNSIITTMRIFGPYIIIAVVLLIVITICLIIKSPKVFCTFEKIDLKTIYDSL